MRREFFPPCLLGRENDMRLKFYTRSRSAIRFRIGEREVALIAVMDHLGKRVCEFQCDSREQAEAKIGELREDLNTIEEAVRKHFGAGVAK
jgi:hypothetical protein